MLELVLYYYKSDMSKNTIISSQGKMCTLAVTMYYACDVHGPSDVQLRL